MTSTDVAVMDGGDIGEIPVILNPQTDIVADLGRWLQAADLAKRIADVACRGPFVPRAFQGKPDHAATAILAGAELGLSPGMALRSFHVIEGTASLSAKTMRALITSAGHELQIGENTAQKCVLRGRRRGEREWTEIEWTIEDAHRAQLTGKDVWKKYPKAMLLARCTTVLGDLKFGDVLAGMPCAEVLQDMDPVDITATVEVTKPADRPTAAAILAASEPEATSSPVENHEPAPASPAPAPVERAVLPVSDAQLRKLGVLFGQLGVKGQGERSARLAIASRIAGRELESSKDLSLDEARILIDTLEGNGTAVIAEILQAAPTPATEDGDELLGDGEDYDPTSKAGWGDMDGGEAAGEELLG